jgi:hypothetical protein
MRNLHCGFSNGEAFSGRSLESTWWAPLKVAVAALGVRGMLIVDHGPWNKPKVQPAFMASYNSTGEAARAAGAQLMPTEQKLQAA